MTSRRHLLRSTLLRVCGSVLLLTLLLALVDVGELLATLRGVAWWVWPLAVVVYLCFHLIGITKWRLLLRAARVDLSFLQVARYYLVGLFGNIFLPSLIGGDLLRTVLAIRSSRRTGGVLLGGLTDRFVDFTALVALAATGAWLTPGVMAEESAWVLRTFALLLAAGGVSCVLLLQIVPIHRLPRRLRRPSMDFQRSLRTLLARPSALVFGLLMALTMQASMVGITTALAGALDVSVPFRVWLFAWPLAKLSSVLPLTQGGIGIREAAQVALLAPLGVPADTALAVGLSFQAIVVCGGLCAGLLSALLARLLREPKLSLAMIRSESQ